MEDEAAPLENSLTISQKIQQSVTNDPAIPLLGIHPKEVKIHPHRNVYTNFHSIIHNIPKAEIAQTSISKLTNVVHPDNGLLLDNEKEQSTDPLYDMDEL